MDIDLVAFVARWPGQVTAGSTCDQLVHQADIIATVGDILQAKLPTNAAEDSFSFLPLLKGSAAPTRGRLGRPSSFLFPSS
jgi:arylsulfatase A-like enzyme